VRVDVVPVSCDSRSLRRLVALARAEAIGQRGGVALLADLRTRWAWAHTRAVFLGRIDSVDVGFVAVGVAPWPDPVGDVPVSGPAARDPRADVGSQGVAGEAVGAVTTEGLDTDVVAPCSAAGSPARTEPVAWVVGPWVEPEARGVGVGEALVTEAHAFARAVGAARLDAFALPGDRETKSAFERAGLVTRALVLSPRAPQPGPAGSGRVTAGRPSPGGLPGLSGGSAGEASVTTLPSLPGSSPSGPESDPAPTYELAVGALLVEGGRCLLVRRGRPPGAGLWSLPGGRVEPDETPERAIVREMQEETGLLVTVDGLVGCAERPGAVPSRRYAILDYRVRRVAGELRAASDAMEARLLGRAEFDTVALVAGLREFLEDHGLLSLLA